MQTPTTYKRQPSLVGRLKNGLTIPISVLILGLILSFGASIFAPISQYNLSEQKIAIQNDLNGMLSSMIDQETGLRGYISTNDPSFLEPFNSGRPQYLASLQQLKSEMQGTTFAGSLVLLAQVDDRASSWYNTFALVQIRNMEVGSFVTARSEKTSAVGKAYFDAFRAAMARLQASAENNLSTQQSQVNTINYSVIALVALISLAAIIMLARTFNVLMNNLREQLVILQDATSQLGAENFSARVPDLTYAELNQLGDTFNTMATSLQNQRSVLQERDILESVLQLNSILTRSLDLDSLAQEFIHSILSLLNLQLGALYLYEPATKHLSLFVSQGLNQENMQDSFLLGEGLVGQVAQNRKALHLTYRDAGARESFSVKTSLGSVLPAGLYHLPLADGKDLLGVLVVGSVYPMNENARNVLNVVASNLTASLSNTQAYRRIQEQTEELEQRSREQESANAALRRQRDDLTVLNAALEDANRARSQFLSTMSHELRTPLTSILGFSQILLRSGDNANFNQRQRSNIERIHKNGQHLLSLINDVLDLAKIEAGRMDVNNSEILLKELLSTVVEETHSIAAERGLDLQCHIEENIDRIETDPIKLRQILLNLISNALKFTEKGAVTITAKPVPQSSDASDKGIARGETYEQIAIAVQDTGIGISPEMQERIFEAFYQVDSSNTRKYGGTGLGLSIVRQLIALLGGRLELQSGLGQGSTFTCYLPLHPRALRVDQHDARLNVGALQAGRTATSQVLETLSEEERQDQHLVLAIDDNPDVLHLINNALENSPYKVVGVNDSTRAVELAQELQPVAVTLDVMMPEINGWQILHQLRSNPATANIPVIMLTVLEDRSAGHVLGADEYLVKPVERESLLTTLRQIARHHPLRPADTPANSSAVERNIVTTSNARSGDQSFLVIHTDRRTQGTLERVLSEAGLSVKTASTEQDMLDIIQTSKPDVIVLRVVNDADDTAQ